MTDLVERVAQMCCEDLTASEIDVAKIAYNLALEEAAKECEKLEKVLAPQQVITDRCAAAIRAMIKD